MLQRLPPPLQPMVLGTALALAYYLTARLGMALAIGPLDITAIWPPSGIALAAFMLLGVRALPGLVAGALGMHYVAFLGPLLGWGTGAALGSVALTSGSLLQALAGLQLLAGHPETAFFTASACGIYLLARDGFLPARARLAAAGGTRRPPLSATARPPGSGHGQGDAEVRCRGRRGLPDCCQPGPVHPSRARHHQLCFGVLRLADLVGW